MLSNYLTIALRSLRKTTLYSALNISGLAIGIAACLRILLFVAHELSYDRWNPQADRIMRPTYEIRVGGFNENHGAVDATVGPEPADTATRALEGRALPRFVAALDSTSLRGKRLAVLTSYFGEEAEDREGAMGGRGAIAKVEGRGA